MSFTFGTDPEFVLLKDDKAFSAIPVLKGDKYKKKKSGNCHFFYDNVLAECSLPPAASKEDAVAIIKDCLKRFTKIVSPYRLEARASHVFTVDQLTHPDAFKINCEKENCAYSMEVANVDEKVFERTNLRSAGGHIHLGDKMIREGYNTVLTVRMMDLFLGIPSIFIDHDPTSKLRKQLYGNAGRYRRTSYGVEYRSMGNFWLSSPTYVALIYDICEFVLGFVESEKVNDLWSIDHERLNSREAWADKKFNPAQCHVCKSYDVENLKKAINNCDKKIGKTYMKYIAEYLPTSIMDQIEKHSEPQVYDLYKEWQL